MSSLDWLRMGSEKAELTSDQRRLVFTVLLSIPCILLILSFVLTIMASKSSFVSDGDLNSTTKQDQPIIKPSPADITGTTNPIQSSSTTAPHAHSTSKSPFGQYRFAAVASDAVPCSTIGTEILAIYKGSTVDAAIATMLCVGVTNLHSSGIGGGHFMTIYDTPRNGSKKVFNTILGRERAPGAATQDMFVDGAASSRYGGTAIAVPGEIKGFHHAWMKYGRLPWTKLIEPSIKLCKTGIVVNKSLYGRAKYVERIIRNNSAIRELLVNADGSLVKEGDVIKRPKLARTLSIIADDPTAYYDPSKQLAKDIVADINDQGGIITLDDLANYEVYDKDPLSVHLSHGNYTVYGPPPPSGAVVLQYIMGILNGYRMDPAGISDTESKILTYHRIAEAFKFAYAKRTQLADEDFVDIVELVENMTSAKFAEETRQKIDDSRTYGYQHYGPVFVQQEDSGTAHASFLGPDGSAVSITSTINNLFGSFVLGPRTGILFNNEMDDFSTPGLVNSFGIQSSPANFIKPGKMPLSSMSPIIVVDGKGDVVYVSGGSGGSRITTAVAYVAIHTLWLGMRIDDATDLPRIHHQLLPDKLEVEEGFDQVVRDGLAAKGHSLKGTMLVEVQTIDNRCKDSIYEKYKHRSPLFCIDAAVDFRKAGKPDGF